MTLHRGSKSTNISLVSLVNTDVDFWRENSNVINHAKIPYFEFELAQK